MEKGTSLIIWDYNGHSNQKWKITPAWFIILNFVSKYFVGFFGYYYEFVFERMIL